MNAVSVDYYPQPHEHEHSPSIKYIEPAYTKAIKYVQPTIAPVPIKHHFAVTTPVPVLTRYQHHEPAPINHYQHHQPAPIKYVHQEPQILKYVDPHPQYVKKVEYDEAPAHYEYAYDVHDELTGDIKSHSEKRDGHSVVGSYTIMDPDG